MHTFVAFAVTYVIGGLTFIPLVLALILLHAYLTFPHRGPDATSNTSRPVANALRHDSDDPQSLLSGQDALSKKFLGEFEKDVAEGYFAVCREYVPGGVNGKPPVRATPAGEVVAGESPSVYQSMYRSLFERRQTPSLTDPSKNDNGKTAKKARNVFYVALRHGHLMLYDDAEQIEVRHVISLEYHDVSIYGGGNEIPEGELWIKRNAIRLSRKVAKGDTTAASLPFYFFSDNCSDKEDFYFALLRNQERDSRDIQPPPRPENFEVKHIISLVQKLHSSEEQLQTRWLNAMVGRLFLAVYRTQEIEDFIRKKITKKISRVKKPAFLSGIQLRNISLGESAPLITNPRLKDLTVDGVCCVEADISYQGGFRIELATTVKIDLGTRFKAREVNLVLAAVVKKLEGHILVRMKPPPSNRLWIAFETMPRLELSLEPIVSSRQITYGIILRAIESRIREVIAETIVLPQWDDTPFLDTSHKQFRGGIWAREAGDIEQEISTTVPNDDSENESETAAATADPPSGLAVPSEKSMSMPVLVDDSRPELVSKGSHQPPRSEVSELRAGHRQSRSDVHEFGTSSSISKRPESPTVTRSKSFASTAMPILSKDSASIDVRRSESVAKAPKNAATLMAELSNRSVPGSPFDSPVGSLSSRRTSLVGKKDSASISSSSSQTTNQDDLSTSQATLTAASEATGPPLPMGLEPKSTFPPSTNGTNPPTRLQAMARSMAPSDKKQQALLNAATAAKNWSWGGLSRKGRTENRSETSEYAGLSDNSARQGEQRSASMSNKASERVGTPENPIGRGRPLPPPGVPLPPPTKRDSISSLKVPKRRPIPPPPLPQRNGPLDKAKAKPELPARARRNGSLSDGRNNQDGLLVVEAPSEDVALPDHGLRNQSIGNDHSDGDGHHLDAGRHAPDADPDGYGEFMDNVLVDEEDAVKGGFRLAEHGSDDAPVETPKASATGPLEKPERLRSYADDDDHGMASWRSAEEEEARSKSVWINEHGQP